MKNKIWKIVVPVLLITVFVAWYAFRPERLFVNKYVVEKLPAANSGSAPQPLESGTFHSVFHPTEGTATVYRTVSVWCKRFSVNFGAAPLTHDEVMSRGQQASQTGN